MKILILENDGYLVESKDAPIVGRHYSLEDAESGSKAQNKAFHALISELYKWMLSQDKFVHQNGNVVYDFSCSDWLELKNIFKKKYGAGFESFIYVGMVWDENFTCEHPEIMDAKTYDQIPESVRNDSEYKTLIRGRLKSWADYTKKQRMKLLDTTINIMDHIGVDSKKYLEIIDGMEEKNEIKNI